MYASLHRFWRPLHAWYFKKGVAPVNCVFSKFCGVVPTLSVDEMYMNDTGFGSR